MNRLGWRLLLSASLFMALPGCDDDDDDGTAPTAGDDDDDDASSSTPGLEPSIEMIGFEQLAEAPDGRIQVSYELTGGAGLLADLTAIYTTNGTSYEDLTLSDDSESLQGVSASPEGEAHTFTWDSLADLGYVDTDRVWIRLSGTADGYEVPETTIQVQLANVQYDKPCIVTLDAPTQFDGDIPLVYHISDEKGDRCDVRVLFDLGGTSSPATLLPSSDSLEDVELEAGLELERHVVWDSVADVGPLDQNVTITVEVTDKNNTVESFQTFDVKNNPTPDEGELVFTEFLFRPDYTFPYVELYNLTNHSLDLEGLHLDADLSEAVLTKGSVSLMVNPKTYVVLAQVELTENDYVDFLVAPLNMNSRKDTLVLWRGDSTSPTVIDQASYDINDANSPMVDFGRSIGLRPEFLLTAGNDTFAAWCLEANPIPGFGEADTDYGSPQAATHCVEETPTPTPSN